MRVVCLSGGVGGAKLAAGLHDLIAPGELTVVGNVGDDVEVLGLHVSPDLDSVLYALAGLNDVGRGWGRAGESWRTLESATSWGGESWFRLGDLDLGLHLVRTQALRAGGTLSSVTRALTRAAGVATQLLPATDDPVRTHVVTPAGRFSFQEWFVDRAHEDEVDAVEIDGTEAAAPAPGVLEALAEAQLVVLAPSNPYVSIGPILAIEPIRAALERRAVPCIAVSPLVAGRAVKGPLDRMLRRMAGAATTATIAARYPGLLDVVVVDTADAGASLPGGPRVACTDILMPDRDAARRLAHTILEELT